MKVAMKGEKGHVKVEMKGEAGIIYGNITSYGYMVTGNM